MDGFKRPRRPVEPRQQRQVPGRQPTSYEQRLSTSAPVRPQPVNLEAATGNVSSPASAQHVAPSTALRDQTPQLPDITITDLPPVRKKRHIVRNLLLGLFAAALLAMGGAVLWYQDSLQPVDGNDVVGQDFSVKQGQTLSQVANQLEQQKLIKNSLAFQLYARFSSQSNIVESNCVIKASQSVHEIVAKLVQGCNEFKSIIFYPGATIEKPLYKPEGAVGDLDSMYIKYRLSQAGYSDQQIAEALNKQYTGPLFADKPAGTTLEGYIYGETYHVDTAASADKVLQTTFDQMYKDITANDLVNKFKAQNLNLFQAITMASIVQRELNCEGKPTEDRKERCYQYQRTIAQVFLKRLQDGEMLGSDVTFIYAADMRGVAPTVDIDSPYNTRLKKGLPPGPIASPGLLALKAVGNPTDTDYNFFIAGDDGLIYFARTLQEHEANIENHCQILCNEL